MSNYLLSPDAERRVLREQLRQARGSPAATEAPPTSAAYGSWRSELSASHLTAGKIALGGLQSRDGTLYWTEGRPKEAGRYALVALPDQASGGLTELTPDMASNCRTRVHEYGGAAYVALSDKEVVYSEFVGQHLRRTDGQIATELTAADAGYRYADGCLDSHRGRLVMVRETEHQSPALVVNQVVAVPLAGGDQTVIASGLDFYSSPRVSPDGRAVCFVGWNHPSMPWDDTAVYVQQIDPAGQPEGEPVLMSSGGAESVLHPTWSSASQIVYLSDLSTGFYNLHCAELAAPGSARCILAAEHDFCPPSQGWRLGAQPYQLLEPGTLLCLECRAGQSVLSKLSIDSGERRELDLPQMPQIVAEFAVLSPGVVGLIGGSTQQPPAVWLLELESGQATVVRESFFTELDPRFLAPPPRAIEFPTSDGEPGDTAHAFFYEPSNPEFQGLQGEQPPCLVKIHGGPTSGTSALFRLDIGYWTSRGIAVLDVDYRGSQGYGRRYRKSLNGLWGVLDVADCCCGAAFCAEKGWVDPNRLCIDGGSAGRSWAAACD